MTTEPAQLIHRTPVEPLFIPVPFTLLFDKLTLAIYTQNDDLKTDILPLQRLTFDITYKNCSEMLLAYMLSTSNVKIDKDRSNRGIIFTFS